MDQNRSCTKTIIWISGEFSWKSWTFNLPRYKNEANIQNKEAKNNNRNHFLFQKAKEARIFLCETSKHINVWLIGYWQIQMKYWHSLSSIVRTLQLSLRTVTHQVSPTYMQKWLNATRKLAKENVIEGIQLVQNSCHSLSHSCLHPSRGRQANRAYGSGRPVLLHRPTRESSAVRRTCQGDEGWGDAKRQRHLSHAHALHTNQSCHTHTTHTPHTHTLVICPWRIGS